MFWFEIIIVLLAIFIGARLKGIGLGVMGGLGLAILTFGFHVPPTSPPVDVLLIIMAVVTAVGILESAGGLRYLVILGEKIIRKHPRQITFIGPLVTYLFSFLAGTSHICYSILPVIAEVAKETGIRPERPLSVSVTAAQQAVTASPISAATAILVGLLSPYGIELVDILKVCVPATLGGVIVATIIANKMGKELHEDPAYLKKVGLSQKGQERQDAINYPVVSTSAKRSVVLLMIGILLIVLFGSFKGLRPTWEVNREVVVMNMTVIIEIIMLATAALIVLLCGVKPTKIVKGHVFIAGIQAVIAIFGISWLGDTFFAQNTVQIMHIVQAYITAAPWQFSIFLFLLSVIVVSQAAAIRALVPLGISLGIPAVALVAMFPAVNGLFFIPNHPAILAAINFDRTGTTRIGKFILNHSFMVPGLVATTTAVLLGFGLIKLLF